MITLPQDTVTNYRRWSLNPNVINGHRNPGDNRTTENISDNIFLGKLGELATTCYYRSTFSN